MILGRLSTVWDYTGSTTDLEISTLDVATSLLFWITFVDNFLHVFAYNSNYMGRVAWLIRQNFMARWAAPLADVVVPVVLLVHVA